MIAWLLAESSEVPAGDAWLLPAERATLARMRHAKRRSDWRLGRWVAKHAVAALLQAPAADIEICAGADGAPFARRYGEPVAAALSISHRAGRGLCVVAAPPIAVGCDLELVECRAPAFEDEWFTRAEQQLLDSSGCDHDLMVTLIWSAKESALKALHAGLRRATHTVVVDGIGDAMSGGWRRLDVRDVHGSRLEGWWRMDGRFVTSVAGEALPSPPVPLAT